MSGYKDLRAMPEEQVIARYDEAMGRETTPSNYWRNELMRRETQRATDELIKLTAELLDYTRQIQSLTVRLRSLTVTVAGAAIVALAVSAFGIIAR